MRHRPSSSGSRAPGASSAARRSVLMPTSTAPADRAASPASTWDLAAACADTPGEEGRAPGRAAARSAGVAVTPSSARNVASISCTWRIAAAELPEAVSALLSMTCGPSSSGARRTIAPATTIARPTSRPPRARSVSCRRTASTSASTRMRSTRSQESKAGEASTVIPSRNSPSGISCHGNRPRPTRSTSTPVSAPIRIETGLPPRSRAGPIRRRSSANDQRRDARGSAVSPNSSPTRT